jgi:predicted RNA-binding protein YlqC (UPF0109 family)
MTIPKHLLGHVIGKAGKYINAVRSTYGVDLRVDDSNPALSWPPTGEVAVTLVASGPREQVWAAAAACVQNLIVGGSPAEGGEPFADTVFLDNAAVPKLIGKAGARINLIRTSSRCKVGNSPPPPLPRAPHVRSPHEARAPMEAAPSDLSDPAPWGR